MAGAISVVTKEITNYCVAVGEPSKLVRQYDQSGKMGWHWQQIMKNDEAAVLVTGGAGYIGSHTVLTLIEANQNVVVVDNLANSSAVSLDRIFSISGKKPVFICGDLLDSDLLNRVFSEYNIGSVLHFAGLKSVSESIEQPTRYYRNNFIGTLNLCSAMSDHGIFKLIFSSSATVYGDQQSMPVKEDMSIAPPTNPYGRSKLMVEEMLRDLARSDERWWIGLLRYFNPVGAHRSGMIGEEPKGIPPNLLPYIAQVATGRLKELKVFGNDYDTKDGTGIRDYVHVVDLAEGHLKALEASDGNTGVRVWNLGAGRGVSVLKMLSTFEEITGMKIPYKIMPRRSGDVAECWADIGKAKRELGWSAKHTLEDMIRDTWRWHANNPKGYR